MLNSRGQQRAVDGSSISEPVIEEVSCRYYFTVARAWKVLRSGFATNPGKSQVKLVIPGNKRRHVQLVITSGRYAALPEECFYPVSCLVELVG